MPIIILEPIRRPPTPSERRGALAGFAWCFVILAAIGLARHAWLKWKGGEPETQAAAAIEAAPSADADAAADSPEDAANREADQALNEMGIAEGLLKQLFPTLDKPAAVASLVKRFELAPDVERRFLALLLAMDERTKMLAGTVLVHRDMVGAAQGLKDRILQDVRSGGPLGSTDLRDLWRSAVEAETDVDVPGGWHAQKIYDRVAAHQLVQRFDVAKQVAAYRQCGEAMRRLVAVNEPLRRLMAALPRDVREQTFGKVPREGADPYFDRQVQAGQWTQYLGPCGRGCGSGLFWMFQINNLDPGMVHDDFERAAQDLERMLLLREPVGRVLHEFQAASSSPQGPVPRKAPEPPSDGPTWILPSASGSPAPPPRQVEDVPAWMAARPAATPARAEVEVVEPARVEPRPEPRPVKRPRTRRSRQLDPRDIFGW
jgi:hypothetical protein